MSYLRPPKITLMQLSKQFQRVAADPDVKTVVLHLRALSMPTAKLDLLRSYVLDLRAAGKRVVAWSYRYDLGRYYLACAADEILLQKGGEIGPLGLAKEYMFLADALGRIGVEADFVQVTPFKSAGDMFSRREMSEEVREMGNWLMDSAWQEFQEAIANGRELEIDSVREMLDSTPTIDLDAKDNGFVDGVLNEDDLPIYLGSADDPIMLTPWLPGQRRLRRKPPRKPGKYVAVLGIEGMIVDGSSQQPPMEPPVPIPFGFETRAGDLSVTQAARQVMTDKRAAALVVYVDSRGGSVTASEAMSAALRKVAEEKPVVVVMGPSAASGGYYVATPGQCILAQPNTITGSIGVIYGKFSIGALLDQIYLRREVISRGEAALFYDPEKKWSESQRSKIWESLQRVYKLFLSRVAESRGMEEEAVDAIGGGRVWTGRQALERGLVDELGGLDQAITKARELAGLREDAGVRVYFSGKATIPPTVNPGAALQYGYESFKVLQGRALCLLPWIEWQKH